jgi:hypothetical protein
MFVARIEDAANELVGRYNIMGITLVRGFGMGSGSTVFLGWPEFSASPP